MSERASKEKIEGEENHEPHFQWQIPSGCYLRYTRIFSGAYAVQNYRGQRQDAYQEARAAYHEVHPIHENQGQAQLPASYPLGDCKFLHVSARFYTLLSFLVLLSPCCSIRSLGSDCTQFHAISKFTILKLVLFTFNAGKSLLFFSFTKNIGKKKIFFLHLLKKMSKINCWKIFKKYV